jgi:RHS repeat-associated protein
MAQSQPAAGTIAVPKGGGAIHGIGETFSPDLFSGTANFTVPITVPNGRLGLQPALALTYSSGSGNGPFGLGWALGVPGISRQTAHGLPKYDASDAFVLSGAEDLVRISSRGARTVYRPRAEGLFAQIERVEDPNAGHDYWEVASKDGLISRYGTPAMRGRDMATVARPRDRARVFAWRLTETVDPFGNRIVYEYERDLITEGSRPSDQLYLKRIRYIDYENAGTTNFLVSVEFYYDTDRADPMIAALGGEVHRRPDPFSDYRATFEIRTARRVAAIVTRTHPAGATPIPSRALRITYLDERTDLPDLRELLPPSAVSLLSRVDAIGFDDGGQPIQEMPSLDFSYSRFEPARRRFVAVPGSGRQIPVVQSSQNLDLIDLHGGGLPDIVELAGSVRYWRNLGGGSFAQPQTMSQAPGGFTLNDAGVALLDANGDGRTDLIVDRPGVSAAFSLTFGPSWKQRPSLARAAPPFDYRDPDVRLIDLDGDGITDAIRTGESLECYFYDPDRGWTHERRVARGGSESSPAVLFSDPRVHLGDMSGDGLQDIVRVHNGSVEYWPSLGDANWGARITMRQSPRFPWGYDPRRVLLGDLDGDGLADLIYLDTNRVLVWFNQSGNGWSTPVEIHGTPPATDRDQFRIIDLYGVGTSGVLFSSAVDTAGQPSMYFLDLSGGVKPYLLTEMDGNLGATTRVGYAPSTRFYLEDERLPATPWRTPLPGPIQVVARVEAIDALSGGKLTTEYRYHYGYWDGVDREFRGFGMVEQFDTETFHNFHARESAQLTGFSAVPRHYFAPPSLTKTWFHQGAVGDELGSWSEPDRSADYWRGDGELLDRRGAVNAFLQTLGSRRAQRDALRALRGRHLRTERYAIDGASVEHRPYSVTETAYGLREFSPPGAGDPARRRVFFAFQTAERTTQWERGDDPMTVFLFASEYDDFGQNRQNTSVAMPRRSVKRRGVQGAVAGVVQPDETRVLVTHTLTTFATADPATPGVPGGRYVHDRIWQTHGFEGALTTFVESAPNDVGQVLRDQYGFACGVRDTCLATFRAWQPGNLPPASMSLTAHMVNHYDGAAFAGRNDGMFTYGSLTRSEKLMFTDATLAAAYADPAGTRRPSYLGGTATLPTGAPANFGASLGYRRETAAPYQRGYYADTICQQYDFQTTGTRPTGWSAWPSKGQAIGVRDPAGAGTTITLDRYWLVPVVTTNAAGLSVAAVYDLRVFQPRRVTDANDNRTQIRFTPHGLPARVWFESQQDANHQRRGGTDARPEFRWTYDLTAFQRTRKSATPQPVSVRSERRVAHASETTSNEVVVTVEYSDGFGRLLQTRAQAEAVTFGATGDDVGLPAAAGAAPVTAAATTANDMVSVSAWQVYDNKGHSVERYEPFFDRGWSFQPEAQAKIGAHAEIYYDARGRVVRTINPDGSQERVIFGRPRSPTNLAISANDTASIPSAFEPTPWEMFTYDAGDLASISKDAQGRSLATRAAASHAFTPASSGVDALGRVTYHVQRNGAAPATDWFVSRSSYDARGNRLSIVDAMGRVACRYVFDEANRALRSESIDSGLQTAVFDARDNTVEARDTKGAIVLRVYDDLNRLTEVWARDSSADTAVTLRERVGYGDGGTATQPTAERDAARLRNALGKPVEHWDEAGVVRYAQYDFTGNLLAKTRQVVSDATLAAVTGGGPWVADWSQTGSVAALDATAYDIDMAFDALSRPTELVCPRDVSGNRRVFRPSYNRAGALTSIRLFDNTTAATGVAYVALIAYNAKGQRTLIEYGNGLMTRYAYDPLTFRLARQRTESIATPRVANRWQGTGAPIQDFTCEFDLSGNLLALDERVANCGVVNSPDGQDRLRRVFDYDPAGRLTSATGRACANQTSSLADAANCGSFLAAYVAGAAVPTQSNAPTQTERYIQTYSYDPVGNLLSLAYDAVRTAGRVRLWARQMGIGGVAAAQWQTAASNRLTSLTVNGSTYSYAYDGSGNLRQQNAATFHEWDHADRMVAYREQAGATPSTQARYLYGADGLRVKKWVHAGTIDESTVYIDGCFEHFRSPDVQTSGENTSIHVLDSQTRVATVRVGNPHQRDASPPITYQLGDVIGSNAIVVDDGATWINREEYFPYGDTSFGGYRMKRYRFSSKERDRESGLTYVGARYLAPFLSRWISCDPAGYRANVNLYQFARGSPLVWIDPSGRQDVLAFIPPGGIEVANLAEGLEQMNQIADLINRTPGLTEEVFLGEMNGQLRILRLGHLGGELPAGYSAIAHTHPEGAMVTYEDVATTRALGLRLSESRLHLVARGGNRWSILEWRVGQAVAQMTEINLARGVITGTADLALAPAGSPLGAMSPVIPDTMNLVERRIGQTEIIGVIVGFARRALGSRIAAAARLTIGVGGSLILMGLENTPHRGAYGEEEDRDWYYTGVFVCMLIPGCHNDPDDPKAPRLVKEERRQMREEARMQQLMDALAQRASAASLPPTRDRSQGPAPPEGAGYQ